MRLIALRAVDAPKVARIDGLDGEEDGLAQDTLALEEITDPRGNPAQVSEVIHGLLAPAEIRILYQAEFILGGNAEKRVYLSQRRAAREPV